MSGSAPPPPIKVKRFLLFAWDTYYPVGGWRDFIAASDDREELEARGKAGATYRRDQPERWDGWQVIDLLEEVSR